MIGVMAFNLLPAQRDQLFLMPPSVRDWLPEGHLAWFVLDVVDELDLSGFYERYRSDGVGRAAYAPPVMVAVVLYAYCVGERSSRRIERRCAEDVAFRVLSANQVPDHATIARFVAGHEAAFSALFCQVLTLCATAGLVKLGVIALDGTKIAANASGQANRTREGLDAEAKRIVAEAIAIDNAEDARYGDARGDELPAELADPTSRRARIAAAKARLDDQDAKRRSELAARMAAKAAAQETRTTRGGGRPMTEKRRRSEPRANLTDPDSSIMHDAHGYLQGYNAQAAVTADQVIVAADVTQEPSDNHQLAPMVAAAQHNLTVVGISEPIAAVVADAGYWSQPSAAVDTGPELFIATRKRRPRAHPPLPSTGRIRASATPLQRMERKLDTKRGKTIYAKRSITVEPVFGQIKETRRARRFHRRGLQAVDSEWKLLATTHNILKLWRTTTALT
jgi:transposase